MSIKIALLKSNEEVICDMKEVITEDNKLAFYSFKHPFVVKIQQHENEEDEDLLYTISYTRWILLSNDREFLINPDWVVTVYNPEPEIESSYKEKINERYGNDRHDGGTGRGDGESETSD